MPDSGEIEIGCPNEVTIIDEFDYVMLDRMAQFSKLIGRKNKVIGLTATSKEDLLAIEHDYLT